MIQRKLFHFILKFFLFILCFLSIGFFCHSQTKGFRLYRILSNLPNDPRWETPPLTPKEKEDLNNRLNQKFTFLGCGGWCFAFLGEDGETVLKFYKHSQFLPWEILRHFSLDKLFLKSAPWPKNTPYFQEFNFKSCMLLYTQAKERAGLLYVHLNKTKGQHTPVTLIDNVGVSHQIDLDQTEFVVQKRATLLMPHLENLMKENKSDEAKKCIDDLFDCFLEFYAKGIRDLDKSLRNNFGFVGSYAIALDISSFGNDESLKNPSIHLKELSLKTHRLERWLRKYHPSLYIHYQSRVKQLEKQ